MRILLVEDDRKVASFIRKGLMEEGYAVDVAPDGETGLAMGLDRPHDVIVLDVMLPGKSGVQVVRELRQAKVATPVLLLTARDAVEDKVQGLDAGADDYLTKPFAFAELLARVRALLRRVEMEREAAPPDVVELADLHLDLRGREASKGGRELALKPKEFDLVTFLARHPRQVFSREQLLDEVWGFEFAGASRTVDVHVRWLRQKIEDDPSRPAHLLTVRGSGYKFVP